MPTTKPWTTADIPPQNGRIALITGATSGLGYESSIALAEAGATVILAGRNKAKGQAAIDKIMKLHPTASIDFVCVDLASLTSISEFASVISQKYSHLDILMNNAGVMIPPKRETTQDGFEIQIGTNYLSHFALTAHLLPLLRKSSAPRVVLLSAIAHRQGKINFDDLQSENCSYGWNVYNQSKLAMLMFGFELQRRSDKQGWGVTSIGAHPGFARTELVGNGTGNSSFFGLLINHVSLPLFGQSAAQGALPQLYAAVSPEAQPGGYYGPTGFLQAKGIVGPAQVACHAKDETVAAKLWDVSCQLTGVKWE